MMIKFRSEVDEQIRIWGVESPWLSFAFGWAVASFWAFEATKYRGNLQLGRFIVGYHR